MDDLLVEGTKRACGHNCNMTYVDCCRCTHGFPHPRCGDCIFEANSKEEL